MKPGPTKQKKENFIIFSLSGLVLASVLLLLLVASGATQQADEETLVRILGLRTPLWNQIFFCITFLGSIWCAAAVTAIGAVLLFYRAGWRVSIAYLSLVGAGSGLAEIIKIIVARPRPTLLLNLSTEGYGYPSSHTMAAVCCYLGLAWLIFRKYPDRKARWGVLAAAGMVVGLVGFSRLYLGWHYPADVIGSVLIGLSLILAVEWALGHSIKG